MRHLFCVQMKNLTKSTPATAPVTASAQRVHQVGARAHGDEAGQRAVVGKAGVIAAHQRGGERAAHHGHQRVDGHEARDLVQGLRTHHVETEPAHSQDPGAEREEGDAGRRMRAHGAIAAVAVGPGAQQQHGGEADPAPHGVHDDAAGKVMELRAGEGLQPSLEAQQLVPGHALEHGVKKAHQHRRGDELRPEARTLGNAARDDGGNSRREGQQEEELGPVRSRSWPPAPQRR